MRTNIYIDGFNFYYGAVKDTQYKWLNPRLLAESMLDGRHDIRSIKYFTARVKNQSWDKTVADRQATYLRALETVDGLTVHLGHFITQSKFIPEANSGEELKFVKVVKVEEKGSDVNLASHLLIDGLRDEYDVAVVISNDGDLKTPVEFVREDFGKPVGILNPHKNRSWALSPSKLPRGSFYKPIRAKALAASQFPVQMEDEHGAFARPEAWG